jgi:hypothetical protein
LPLLASIRRLPMMHLQGRERSSSVRIAAHGQQGTKESARIVSRNGARNLDTIFIELLKTAPSTALIVAMLWYGQKGIVEKIDKMSRRMDCFETAQHACQLDNVKSYATKADLHVVEEKLDKRITRLEDDK